jgi:hypothetical protein
MPDIFPYPKNWLEISNLLGNNMTNTGSGAMLPKQYNDNPPKSKRQYTKKKNDLEALPLKIQLQTVMDKFDDPLSEVLSILDPFHDKIVRPEINKNPNIPEDPNYGLFRVIYWIRDDDGTKFHTIITKAKDGYDARADVEIEFIDLHKSNLMKVVGVECVIVPKKYIWKINEEFPINEQKGLIKIQADLEKADIVRKLELFEDEKPDPDLSKFIDDDQSDIDK